MRPSHAAAASLQPARREGRVRPGLRGPSVTVVADR
jgi:hypothetical protein